MSENHVTSLRGGLVRTAREAHQLEINWSDFDMEYAVQMNAIDHPRASESESARFRELLALVDEKRQQLPSIYLDTTTIWTAMQLASGDASILSGYTLMDLDKVTRAFILNDRIFHLPSRYIEAEAINRMFGEEILVPLTLIGSSDELNDVIWQMWTGTAPSIANRMTARLGDFPSNVYERGDSRHLFGDLVSFHGLPMEETEWKLDSYEGRIFTSDPLWLVKNLLEDKYDDLNQAKPGMFTHGFRSDAIEAVKELVHRATFQQILAEALGLVYDPSFVRMPAIGHLTRNSTDIALALADIDELERLIEERLLAVRAEALEEAAGPVSIPPFTAYVLKKVDRVEQWWQVVSELRRHSARYRRARRNLQEALLFGEVETIRRLRAELDGSARAASDERVDASLDTVIGMAPALFAGTSAALSSPILHAIRLIIGKPFKGAVDALRRRLRPELRLFHDVGQAATSYVKLHNKIRLLWHVNELPRTLNELDSYAVRAQAQFQP
jgi:hypothetical protein